MAERLRSSSSAAIGPSNIGFKLLKKSGWKEGTGLGVSEQGHLEPLELRVKNNKRGLGAEEEYKAIHDGNDPVIRSTELDIKAHNEKLNVRGYSHNTMQQSCSFSKRSTKTLSRRMRKLQEAEKLMLEKEFEMAFFREFWPENL